jgi:palmitoyltransferase
MSPSRDFHRKRKSWARRVERCCCGALGYFPLAFVYGLLSWAAWVQISIGFWPNQGKWTGILKLSCLLTTHNVSNAHV